MTATHSARDHTTAGAEPPASDLRARAAAAAGSVFDSVADAATQRIDTARDAIGSATEQAAGYLHEAASRFSPDSFEARALDTLASGFDAAARNVNDRTLPEIADAARDAARRHPGLVLAGAALAGFAVARLLRATDGSDDGAAANPPAQPPRAPGV